MSRDKTNKHAMLVVKDKESNIVKVFFSPKGQEMNPMSRIFWGEFVLVSYRSKVEDVRWRAVRFDSGEGRENVEDDRFDTQITKVKTALIQRFIGFSKKLAFRVELKDIADIDDFSKILEVQGLLELDLGNQASNEL